MSHANNSADRIIKLIKIITIQKLKKKIITDFPIKLIVANQILINFFYVIFLRSYFPKKIQQIFIFLLFFIKNKYTINYIFKSNFSFSIFLFSISF